MGRPKGSLKPEHIAAMQAGRKAAKEKASEGLIDKEVKVKKVRDEVKIVGYGFYGNDILPIFTSEKDTFKGKIYASAQEAKELRK